MIKVGITGGIGTGKTTICRLFEILGMPVFYADDESKNIIQSDATVVQEVAEEFGNALYENGILNKEALAKIVFNDPEKLKSLNAIVHPAVFRKFQEWLRDKSNFPYVLKEAALIFEAGGEKELGKVIVVAAPEELRIQRIITRDDTDADSVKARMKNQWPEQEKLRLADFVINNDEKTLVIPQVLAIHQQLINLSQKHDSL